MARKKLTTDLPSSPHLERDDNLSFLLISTANKLVAGASLVYKRHFGIGIMEWRVLALIAAEPGITAKTIGVLSGVDKAAVSRAAAALNRRGHIVMAKDKNDNRASRLGLTTAGRNLHSKVIKVSLERDRLLSEALTAQEHDVLFALLRRLVTRVPLVNACEPARESRSGKRAPARARNNSRSATAARGA